MSFKKIATYTLFTSVLLSGCGDEEAKVKIQDNLNATNNVEEQREIRISAYSKSKGLSLEESERRLGLMDKAYMSYPMLEEYFRDSITGAYFDDEDEFGLTIRTNRQDELSLLDEQIIKEVRDTTGLPLRIKNNSTKSSQEIQDMLTQQMEVIMGEVDGLQSIGYDPENDKIVIEVHNKNLEGAKKLDNQYDINSSSRTSVYNSSLEGVEELRHKYSLNNFSGMDVDFKVLENPIEPAVLAGGGQLVSYDRLNRGGKCTAGFSAYAPDGTPAIVTAFHCLNRTNDESTSRIRSVYTDNNGTSHNLTPAATYPSANHDMALLLAPKGTPLTAGTYTDSNFAPSPIVQQGTRSSLRPKNDFLCHYGRTTGFSCGEVQRTNVSIASRAPSGVQICNTTKNACNATFIQISDTYLNCAAGDSGGPVFSFMPVNNSGGYAAYGILSGCTVTNGVTNVYLSSLDYLSEIGATLAIS